MRSKTTAVAIAALALIATVRPMQAQVFNNPVNTTPFDAGAFSQANQQLANAFALASATNVNGAVWFGTMFAPDPLNTGDTWDFNLVFRDATLSSIVASRSVTANVTDTGLDVPGGLGPTERLYQFSASFADISLPASTIFYLSILNTGTQNTFRWTQSTGSGPSAISGDGVNWDSFDGDRTPLNFSLNAVTATATPEPATISLFAIGLVPLVISARRRRSA